MEFIKTIPWKKIFENWRESEEKDLGWIECATKVKGWPNWESWRKHTANQIGASERDWGIYELDDPSLEISQMLVGPYSGWQSRLSSFGKNVANFKDLLSIPEQLEEFSKNNKVVSILEGLPFSIQLIGAVREDSGKVVLLEGHHRAVAIVIAQMQGKNISFDDIPVTIALTRISMGEVGIFDKMLKRGTSKE